MDGKKRSQLILLGLFVLVVLGLFGYLALQVGTVRTGDGITVEIVFDDAQGLVENGSVRIAGITVGAIDTLRVDGGKARATVHIYENTVVRKDVVATIKAKSLLGEKFIELQPKSDSAPPLAHGDVITDTYISAELPDLASQIAPLLSKVDPDDVARLVNVMGKILEQNADDLPRIVESMGNMAVNLDNMIEQNGPKINALVDAAYESGPKVGRLLDTTQRTLDNTNAMLENNSPKVEKFVNQLSELDLARVNRMIVEFDEAVKDGPAMLSDARQLLTRTNALLGGFEGLTWFDLKHLVRDEGIHVRMMSRSDDVIAAERDEWRPPLKTVADEQ